VSSSRVGNEQLEDAWRSLELQWQATCELWQDPVRDAFEREFWQEWKRTVTQALRGMEDLNSVIRSARRAVR